MVAERLDDHLDNDEEGRPIQQGKRFKLRSEKSDADKDDDTVPASGPDATEEGRG
jgi:hypothetical protein